MRVAILSSGGKDSTYAHWWATLQGWDVLALVTCKITDDDSMMFQIPGTEIVKLQSIVTSTKYLELEFSGKEEIEMLELTKQIKKNMVKGSILENIDGIVTGALKSDYQKSKIERMCEDLGIHSFSPLWHKNSNTYMGLLVNNNFEMIMTSVSCEGLDESWLGSTIDTKNLEELCNISEKYRFNIDGEGGEFETSVINAPHFKSKIYWEGEKVWKRDSGMLKFISLRI